MCGKVFDGWRGNLYLQRVAMNRVHRLQLTVQPRGADACDDDRNRKAKRRRRDQCQDALESEQPFNVFFGGERALTEIYTTAVNGEKLLVVGDRTADTIVPLFVSSFENIVLMHPSVCTKTIEELVEKYQPTKILYLYDANVYMTDSTLLRALQ